MRQKELDMEIRELSGLDLSGARDLLFACATDAKRLEKEIAAVQEELRLWTGRVTLAESRNLADLAGAARTRAAEIAQKHETLTRERAAIISDVNDIREALPLIKAKERSVDPDRLLAELQLMTGELLEPDKAKLDREMTRLESSTDAENSLAALKRKMAPPASADEAAAGRAASTGSPIEPR